MADNLPPSSADVTESGSLSLPEPSGPHRPVTGLLYLYQCNRHTLHALLREDGFPGFLALLFQQRDKRCEVTTDLEDCWPIFFNLMTQNSLDEIENKNENPRTLGNPTAFYFRQVTSIKGGVKWQLAKTIRIHTDKKHLLNPNSKSAELGFCTGET
jgi:hypothetical protein